MISVVRVPNPFVPGERVLADEPDGLTGTQLLARHRLAGPTQLVVDGRPWTEDQLGQVVPAGSSALVTARIRGPALAAGLPWFAALVIDTVVLVTLATVFQRLTAPSRPPLEPGDELSPSHAWSGISTGYGPGYRIPVPYGDMRSGGHVIASRIRSEPGYPGSEVLEVLVAIGEGRIQSIGGITGNSAGEADNLGRLFGTPDTVPEVYVDGNLLASPGFTASLRCGTLDQNPIRDFPDASTAVAVGASLDDQGQVVTANIGSADARSFHVKLVFPGGLFKQSQTSPSIGRFQVSFRIEWRPQNVGGWVVADTFTVDDATRSRLVHERFVQIPEQDGPFVVRVTRTSGKASGTDFVQSSCQWQTLTYYVPGQFAYPGLALLRLAMLANERQQNSFSDIVTPRKGRRVRVWDATNGFSAETYELPASGVFSGIWTYPPGRNPGWIALDWATKRYGLGAYTRGWNINHQSFRNLADHCDVTVDGEMRFAFDDNVDGGESAWDVLQRILRVANAQATLVGNTLKVVYEYRDAHGRGTNSVAARARVAKVNTASLEECEVSYRDRSARPNIIDVQILNRELDFEQDLISVEDAEAFGLNEPTLLNSEDVRRDTIEMFGCTSPKQARRTAIFAHRVNRLCHSEVRMVAWIDQLALEVKDIVGVESDVFRPFDQTPSSMRATVGGTITQITVDHPVTVNAAIGQTRLIVVDTANTVQERQVTMADGTYAAGTLLTLASAVTIAKGVPVTVGYAGKVLRDYVVTSIARRADGKREIRGVEWQPTAFDIPVTISTEFTGDEMATTGIGAVEAPPAPEAVTVALDASGATQIGWRSPLEGQGRKARFFLAPDDDQTMRLLGEAAGSATVAENLEPHRAYILRVTSQDSNGAFHAPTGGLAARIIGPEFRAAAPGPIHNLAVTNIGDALVVRWDHVAEDDLDYYEVRQGSTWVGSQLLGRVRENEWRWHSPAFFTGAQLVMVRARLRRGVYGAMSSAALQWAGKSGTLTGDTESTLFTTSTGTPTDCTWDTTDLRLRIDAGKYDATYVAGTLNLPGSASRAWWLASLSWAWVDTESTVDEDDRLVGSDEEMFAFVDGREPSEHAPGCDLVTNVDDDDGLVDDDDGLVHGEIGTTGHHATAWLEVRWSTSGSSFGPWERFYPQERYAQEAQLRIRMRRHDTRYRLDVHQLSARVFYG